MGLLLDIVPNHMAASSENRWWMDVLENGPESTFASYFDIDWRPGSKNMDGRILLPVLGKPFGEVLDSGDLVLTLTDATLTIKYFDLTFPVAPRSYRGVFQHAAKPLRALLGEESSCLPGIRRNTGGTRNVFGAGSCTGRSCRGTPRAVLCRSATFARIAEESGRCGTISAQPRNHQR